MNLMTAEEIKILQKEFDDSVDSSLSYWAEDSVLEIEKQIKAKNTGAKNTFEGMIQISPHKFYISRELTKKIDDSQKTFHNGGDIYANMYDELFEDNVFNGQKIELYNMAFLSEEELKIIKDINKISWPNRYLACFGASLENSLVEEQKGWIFKRTVKVKRQVWKFKGISLKFLEKFESACKKEGIEILGAEIVFYNKDISSYTPIVYKMDDVYGSCVCNNIMGSGRRAVVLKWRYVAS